VKDEFNCASTEMKDLHEFKLVDPNIMKHDKIISIKTNRYNTMALTKMGYIFLWGEFFNEGLS